MRIVAGEARGVRLAPVPRGVRPTSDRVREDLFNALGQFFDRGEVLDLYAGTGALGIEALSRGCKRCTFVERSGRALSTIRENLKRTHFEKRAELVRGDVKNVLGRLVASGRTYDLIFADPPYRIAAAEVDEVLAQLGALLASGGRAVIERGGTLAGKAGHNRGDTRHYGGTVVTIFEKSELL